MATKEEGKNEAEQGCRATASPPLLFDSALYLRKVRIFAFVINWLHTGNSMSGVHHSSDSCTFYDYSSSTPTSHVLI